MMEQVRHGGGKGKGKGKTYETHRIFEPPIAFKSATIRNVLTRAGVKGCQKKVIEHLKNRMTDKLYDVLKDAVAMDAGSGSKTLTEKAIKQALARHNMALY